MFVLPGENINHWNAANSCDTEAWAGTLGEAGPFYQVVGALLSKI